MNQMRRVRCRLLGQRLPVPRALYLLISPKPCSILMRWALLSPSYKCTISEYRVKGRSGGGRFGTGFKERNKEREGEGERGGRDVCVEVRGQ